MRERCEVASSRFWPAAQGMPFSRRWNGGTISLNLGVIWEMPAYDIRGRSVKYLVAFLLALVPAGPAAAETNTSASAMATSMAQHFVQEQFMFGAMGDVHYHIEFDISYLVPQPEPNYWAVVGGFVSDQSTPNSFVAAVRLICPDQARVACWRLEKLVINQKIVVDLGQPL